MRVFISGSNRLLISKKNNRSHLMASYSHRLYTSQRKSVPSTVMAPQSYYITNAANATQLSKEEDDAAFSFSIAIDGYKCIAGAFFHITSLLPISLLKMPSTGRYAPAIQKIFTWYH